MSRTAEQKRIPKRDLRKGPKGEAKRQRREAKRRRHAERRQRDTQFMILATVVGVGYVTWLGLGAWPLWLLAFPVGAGLANGWRKRGQRP